MQTYDLTHTLTTNSPLWNPADSFNLITKLDYDQCRTKTKFRVQSAHLEMGSGTHLDAPAHIIAGGLTVDQIPLIDLIAPLIIIDMTTNDPRKLLTKKVITDHESKEGNITKDSVVIIKTGWSRFWNEPLKYRNNYQYPSISTEAAQYLLEKNIKGLGIDTLSPDCDLIQFPVHSLFLGAGKYLIENLLIPDILEKDRLSIMIMPLKIEGATESPCRVLAIKI